MKAEKETSAVTIYDKLFEFQKLNITIKRDGSNPHFKSKYSTLNEVLDKVRKPLNELGVLIIFTPNENGMLTTLRHVASGTEVVGYSKYVGISKAQDVLSCNTYYCRGTLQSMLGLEADDDDGNSVSGKVVLLPYLNESSDEFARAKKHIEGGGTISDIKVRYRVSAEVERMLLTK
jgi:hypothetical protein